ncbi:MAG: hypothetical protein LBU32_32655 [Clostridiales bacterium]|nr:hypothetical protein [Clostridiales bacterium]
MLGLGGRLYVILKKASKPIDDADNVIAACCIVNGYTLVTNNNPVDGLKLVNWVE